MQKQQFFAPFQSYICSNSIHRMQLVLNPTPDTTETRPLLSISRNQACMQPKLQQHPYHLLSRKCFLDRCEYRTRHEKLSSCQLLNVKNQTYLYLPTFPLNSFRFFRFLLQPRFCLCNMPFLIFYPPSRDKTYVCFQSFLENLM